MKKTLSYAVLLAIVTACSSTFTQRANVEIDRSNDRYDPEEPCIMVNPNNPDNIVVAANIDNMYVSMDGGLTWKHQTMESSLGVYGDPVVVHDKDGNFLFFHLSDVPHAGWDNDSLLDRMVCQRSIDGGVTWSDGVGIGLNHGKDQDKEWAVLDPNNGNVYLTWTQFDKYMSTKPGDSSNVLFSKSADNGLTWTDPIKINQYAGICLDDDSATEGAFPAVLANGNIGVSWAFGDKIYFDRSEDGGQTWLQKDIVAGKFGGGWNYNVPGISRSNGLPVLKCDLSQSKHHGKLYINWTDQSNGEDDTDVWLITSTDNGTTWSPPKRVNNDKPGKHQFLSWMDVDPATGFVYIVYYDRRNHSDQTTDVYVSWSENGGSTFKHRKISEKPFFPNEFTFFGDYTNIVARNGVIHPVWTRMDTGKLSVMTTKIDVR